jgi:hypothetical protein
MIGLMVFWSLSFPSQRVVFNAPDVGSINMADAFEAMNPAQAMAAKYFSALEIVFIVLRL